MLIDARHPEETRVAVVKGNQVEDFDYESIARDYHKGNIYLAKVTRVEPSLQACFVDYGENRHGFLAFSEIHPDYYLIPSEDREALLAEEAEQRKSHAAKPHPEDEEDKEASSEDADNGDHEDEISDVEHISGEDDYDDVSSRKSSNLRRRYKIQEVIKRRQILLIQVVKEERGTKGAALTTYLSLAGRYCVLMPNSQNGGGISRKISNIADRKKLKDVMSALDVPEGMGCIIRTAGLNRTKTEIKRDFDYLLRLWDGIRERTLESVAPILIHEEADLIKRSIRDLYSREIDEIHVEGEEGYRTAKDFMKLLMPSHARRVQHYKDRIPLFHRYQVEDQLDAMYSPTVQLKSGGYLVINPTEALIAIDVNSGRSTKEHNIEETALKTNLEASDEVARQLRLRDLAGLVVIDFIDMEDRSNNRAVEKRLKEALKSDRARIQVGRISSFGLLEMSRQRLRPNLLEATRLPCPHCSGTGIVPSKESASLNILRALEEEGIRDRSSAVTIRAPAHVAFYLLNQKRDVIAELEKRYAFVVTIEAGEKLGSTPYEVDRVAKTAEQRATETREAPGQVTAAPAPANDKHGKAVSESTDDTDSTPDTQELSPQDEEQAPRKRRRRRRRGRRGRSGEDQANGSTVAESGSDDSPAITADHDSEADSETKDPAQNADNGADQAQTDTVQLSEAQAEKNRDERRPRRRSHRRRPSTAKASVGENGTADNAPDNAAGETRQETAGTTTTVEKPAPETVAADSNGAADEKPVTTPSRRRRVRRKAPSDMAETTGKDTSDPGESAQEARPSAQAEPQAESSATDAEETKARAPSRPRRRRKPAAGTTAVKPAAESTDTPATPEKSEKPAEIAVSRPRADAVAEGRTVTAPKAPKAEDTAQTAPSSASQPAEASSSVTAPAATETVERRVITPNGTLTHQEGKEDHSNKASRTEPRKRGWWQRALGR